MKREYPPLCRKPRMDAHRQGEAQQYEDSFRLNVSCARAIEQAIREHFHEDDPQRPLFDGCAQSVLEEYGFQRVEFVLANTLQNAGCQYLHRDEVRQWGKSICVPSDNNRYFVADTAAPLLDAFVDQFRKAYQSLGPVATEEQAELKGPDQEQTEGPAQGGMEMR